MPIHDFQHIDRNANCRSVYVAAIIQLHLRIELRLLAERHDHVDCAVHRERSVESKCDQCEMHRFVLSWTHISEFDN